MHMQIIIEHILRSEKMDYLNQNEKSVIFWIGSHMGNKMIAWPSNERLARVCSRSVKTIQRTIKSLEAKNILIVERKHRKNNVYSFNPSWLAIFDSLGVKLGKLGRQTDAQKVNLGRQIVYLGRQTDSPRASNCRTNNINNNINNNSEIYVEKKYTPSPNGKQSEWFLELVKQKMVNKLD